MMPIRGLHTVIFVSFYLNLMCFLYVVMNIWKRNVLVVCNNCCSLQLLILLHGLPHKFPISFNWSQIQLPASSAEPPSFHHVTAVLQELLWLLIKSRIAFKILLLTFKASHNIAPPYLSVPLHVAASSLSLRSSSSIHLTVTSARLSTMGSRTSAAL